MIPLVVYGKLVDTGLEGYAWFSDNASVLDVFLYHKQQAVIISACMIILFMIYGIARKELKCNVLFFLPLVIYAALAVLSSVVSPYSGFAWKGMMEQYESVWVLAGYLLICIYGCMACGRGVFTAFGIVCGITGAVGTFPRQHAF